MAYPRVRRGAAQSGLLCCRFCQAPVYRRPHRTDLLESFLHYVFDDMREPLTRIQVSLSLSNLLAAPQALGRKRPELPPIRAGTTGQTPNTVFAQGR